MCGFITQDPIISRGYQKIMFLGNITSMQTRFSKLNRLATSKVKQQYLKETVFR